MAARPPKLSDEARTKVVRLVREGQMTKLAIAQRFGVAPGTITKIMEAAKKPE